MLRKRQPVCCWASCWPLTVKPSVVATCDNVVFPAPLAAWPGAAVVTVEGAAHLDLLERPEVWGVVVRALSTGDRTAP